MKNNIICSDLMNICSALLNGGFMDELLNLIDSKSKKKLLEKLIESGKNEYSISELGRLANLPKATVSTIITQWGKIGAIISREHGRNKLISINQHFYILPELKKILEKTRNPQKILIKNLKSLLVLKNPHVKTVIIFGSRTRDDYTHFSDLDILIEIENKNHAITEKITEELVKETEKTGIHYSPIIMEKKEIETRIKEKDKLIHNILLEGKIIKGGKWFEHLQTAP